ncbi:MAG: putative manganese transporter, partial [Lachnospira sp.]|nr:putative manganese transporter [Lachnospira sp.]
MLEQFLDVIVDTLIDGVKLLPFLFLTYLAMEYIEHKVSGKTKAAIKKSGKAGPLIGGVLGAFPQCGFSTAASNLYAGKVITVGTLIAIYLSTSDEMLPVMLSEKISVTLIIKIILTKVVIAVIAGLVIDFVIRKIRKPEITLDKIGHMCDHDHCHCEKSIFKSALKHTVVIFGFILGISFILNVIIMFIGEDTLAGLILNRPVIGPLISGIVGLIPNCAASVVITQLYINGVMSFGSMMAGLLPGSGVGILVLFKENDNLKEN